jgi:predicted MPP superfamily phosphohydrolase
MMPISSSNSPAGAAEKSLSRRKFLRRAASGLAATATGTFLYTWRIEPHLVETVHQAMFLAGLPEALVGKRLVQLSDVHAGPVVDQSYLLAAAERVAELRPDVLVLTGDLMTCRGAESVPLAVEFVDALPQAPLGRFAVLGNHDFGDRWRQDAAAAKLVDAVEKLDVRVLRNDVADIAGLQIAGVDDLWSQHFRLSESLGKLASKQPAIALCHNPDAADRPEWEDFRGWILAGHTHGGQCKAPFLRPPLLPVRNKRYVAGDYELAEGRRMYINRGLGYMRRVRFNCRPEITVFTLERAEA